jgi:excisionase family DNA binding protein
MIDRKLLYRVPEAAESLGLSRAKLYQLMATGEIESVKIANSRRIPAAELEAFVNRLRTPTEENGSARGAASSARIF